MAETALALVAISTAIVVASCGSSGTGRTTFEELLAVIPDTPETRSYVLINDYAMVRELFNIPMPAPDASDDELWEFIRVHFREPAEDLIELAPGPWISGYHQYGRTFLGSRHFLSFDVRNVDQSVVAWTAQLPLEVAQGRFDPEATNQALNACFESQPPAFCGPVMQQKAVVAGAYEDDPLTQINLNRAVNLAKVGKLLDMSGNEMDSGEVIVGTQVQEVTQEVTDQSLIQEEHHGVPFYVWDEDLREDYADRFKLPAYDERGRASSIAVQDERVFRTVETEGIRAMIEASQGQRGSLADVEEFLLLAKKMSSLGAFSMRLSDRTYLMSEENLSRVNPYSRPGQFERLKESALPLRPYQAFAAGAGQDDQGPYMAVVLVHSDAEAAADNIDLLRRRIENTRVIDNSLDWIDVVDDMEIWAEGRALLAKLRGRISIRWLNFVAREDLPIWHE